MSLLATTRGTTSNTGANITYTFPTGNIDTTTLQPSQAFDLRTYLISLGILTNLNVTTKLKIIIPSGCTLGSSSSTKPVITVANFKNRDRITIINNGNIYGAGGTLGAPGYSNSSNGTQGGTGGSCLLLSNYTTIINNGFIYAGGGGGGGGGGYYAQGSCYFDNNTLCNGQCFDRSGSGCTGSQTFSCPSSHKYCGSTCCRNGDRYPAAQDFGGFGGTGFGYNNTNINGTTNYTAGGSGGMFGQAGGDGGSSSTTGGTGGLAGHYIIGFTFANITLLGNVAGRTV